jgi:uncharacterized membrane protein YeaQ/YmgE (transglycosylase-associated protein family)
LHSVVRVDIITWLFVGLVAGVLASFVSRGGGFGILGDILLGIAGAFIGAWGFQQMHWHSPIKGLGGTIFVAFLGAVVLLFAIRLVQRTRIGRG